MLKYALNTREGIQKMTGKQFYKIIIGTIGIVSFSAMGWFGMQFIKSARKSAAGIQNHTTSDVTNVSSGVVSLEPNQVDMLVDIRDSSAVDLGNRTGEDVVILAGEFSYINGVPIVRLQVRNQGKFTVSSLFVNLSLSVKINKNQIHAREISQVTIPVSFDMDLMAGSDAVVEVPIPADATAWRSAAVRQAKERFVNAKIVSVGDAENGGLDYPQTSSQQTLAQTQNDWGVASEEMSEEARMPHETEAQQDWLPDESSNDGDNENNVPTGESRVLSHEVSVTRKPEPQSERRVYK